MISSGSFVYEMKSYHIKAGNKFLINFEKFIDFLNGEGGE